MPVLNLLNLVIQLVYRPRQITHYTDYFFLLHKKRDYRHNQISHDTVYSKYYIHLEDTLKTDHVII